MKDNKLKHWAGACLAFLACLNTSPLALSQQIADDVRPELLNFEELKQLSELDPLVGPLAQKVRRLRNTPFISNAAARRGTQPIHLQSPELGPHIRAAQWNIERGINLDLIKVIFSEPEGLQGSINSRTHAAGSPAYNEALEQARILSESSILILNELDLGMPRTDYRDVTEELAQAANMNYVYGVEFFEIDKIQLDVGQPGEDKEPKTQFRKAVASDPGRYKGLHGNAILSRYPIISARVVPLDHQGYDWYRTEMEKTSLLENARRGAADKIFLERVTREVRRGGRTVLIADLEVPELPEKRLTVINLHLENRCKPGCREDQMKEILALIQPIQNPVIMAGDLNTTSGDATPTSFKRELKKRYKDPHFWGSQVVKLFTPIGLTLDAVGFGINFSKVNRDPTSNKIPLLAPQTEGELFDEIKDFRFSDGKAFDFRGDANRTLDGNSKTLANSNARARIGFKPTYEFERSLENALGEFKLDWFFVKPDIKDPTDEGQNYAFAPHYPRTLDDLNKAFVDRISDHNPITVDLPLAEPPLRAAAKQGQNFLRRIVGIFR